MNEKIDFEVVRIPTLSEVRAQRYRDRIYEIVDVMFSLDPDENAYVIRLLNRESQRLLRLLIKEGYDV